jgi:hypothetical protein
MSRRGGRFAGYGDAVPVREDCAMRRWIGVRGSRFLAALMTVVALTCAAAAQDRVALVVGNRPNARAADS